MVRRLKGRPARVNSVVPALAALRGTLEGAVDGIGVYCFATTGDSWPTPGTTDLQPVATLDGLSVESILAHSAKGGGSRIADAINHLLDVALASSDLYETTIVIVCDGGERASACWSNRASRAILVTKIKDAKDKGVTVSLIGIVDAKEEARVRSFAADLGVSVVIHSHGNDEASQDGADAMGSSFAAAAGNLTQTISVMFNPPIAEPHVPATDAQL